MVAEVSLFTHLIRNTMSKEKTKKISAKKSVKPAKKQKKVAPKKSSSAKSKVAVNKKPSLIENVENIIPMTEYIQIPKISFDQVNFVFNALFEAYRTNEDLLDFEQEDMDEKFRNIFSLFCHSVGWNEAEYFDVHNQVLSDNNGVCPTCQAEKDDMQDLELKDSKKDIKNSEEVIPTPSVEVKTEGAELSSSSSSKEDFKKTMN
jgi:hypothetical protein